MTISNHAQTHSNGAKKNGERDKAKHPESAKGAAPGKAEGHAQPETHPKNGTAKKQGKSKPTPAQEMPRPQRVLGYRGHCEEESHFPTTSLLFPDLDSMKKWVATMASSLVHVNCVWKAEQVFLAEDGHLYSRVGEMDREHPGTGLVQWSENPPFDLGPLPSGALPELGQKDEGAQSRARAVSKTETEPRAKTNGEPTHKSFGESAPAPKPSQSGERTARAKSGQAKSAPPKRVPTRAFRMKAASKHAKRA